MALLALLLFSPWFAVLAWVYWRYPRDLPATAARRRFDVIALVLAVVGSGAGMVWAYGLRFDHAGPIWPQVIATLVGYHVFLAVLTLAFAIRRRRHGAATAPRSA